MAVLQFLAIFIVAPWLAFVVSALFFFLYHESHSRVVVTTAGAWLLYGVYEYLMYLRILCTGECNIRVDLLLFYPLLESIPFLVEIVKHSPSCSYAA